MMNERIKELAMQADLYARSDNSSMVFENFMSRYSEKFAELIINECTEIVISCDESVKCILHEPYRTVVRKIQDNMFGVEE